MNQKFVVMGLLSGVLSLLGCNNSNSKEKAENGTSVLIAKQISIQQLPVELQKLAKKETEFDFIGITSNGIDCIYFVRDNNKFQIEFEAMIEQQIPYIEKLKEFAGNNNYKFSMTTYGNQPQYNSSLTAPVIRIETNSDIEKSAEIGQQIESSIFNNNDKTVYDVVP